MHLQNLLLFVYHCHLFYHSLVQVIQAIKNSLDRTPPEMTMVIKPRDLTRVDPTLNLPSRMTMSDPAMLLRDSVKQLKEVN